MKAASKEGLPLQQGLWQLQPEEQAAGVPNPALGSAPARRCGWQSAEEQLSPKHAGTSEELT